MFVKICGVTDVDDGLLAVALGADALGLNFVPGSVRQIAPGRARDIVARIPGEVMNVGIFRNEAKERVVDIVHTAGLDAAQLHGNEPVDDVAWVAERVPTVIKAVAAGTEQASRAATFPCRSFSSTRWFPAAGKCSTGRWPSRSLRIARFC